MLWTKAYNMLILLPTILHLINFVHFIIRWYGRRTSRIGKDLCFQGLNIYGHLHEFICLFLLSHSVLSQEVHTPLVVSAHMGAQKCRGYEIHVIIGYYISSFLRIYQIISNPIRIGRLHKGLQCIEEWIINSSSITYIVHPQVTAYHVKCYVQLIK